MTKSVFDKNMEKFSEEFEKVSDEVKDTAWDIESRRSKSSDIEKITMLIWIILLVRALCALRDIVWWVILLVLWILFVSGFFDTPLKDLTNYTKKQRKAYKKESAKKSTKKEEEKKE